MTESIQFPTPLNLPSESISERPPIPTTPIPQTPQSETPKALIRNVRVKPKEPEMGWSMIAVILSMVAMVILSRYMKADIHDKCMDGFIGAAVIFVTSLTIALWPEKKEPEATMPPAPLSERSKQINDANASF